MNHHSSARTSFALVVASILAALSGGSALAQPAPLAPPGAEPESLLVEESDRDLAPEQRRSSAYRPGVSATPSEPQRVGLSNGDFTPADFAEPDRQPAAPPAADREGDALEPWVFVTLAATTGVLGAFTIASGIDTLSKNGDYKDYARYPDSSPAAARRDYADAHSAQTRTNVLIGSTVVLAAASLVIGVWWTDWGSEHESEVKLSPFFGARAAGLQLEHAL